MVLQSQMSRMGIRPHGSTSFRRRRRFAYLPQVVLALLAVAILAAGGHLVYHWLTGSRGVTHTPAMNAQVPGQAASAGVSAPTSPAPLTAAITHVPPPAPFVPRAAPPVIPPAGPPLALQASPPVASGAAATMPAGSGETGGTRGTDIAAGMALLDQGKKVEGRKLLSALLIDDKLPPEEAQKVRDALTAANAALIFSPHVTPGDPLVDSYIVKSGDRLAKITPRYKVPYQFIETINGVAANRIQVGQKIKLINGPFHLVVTKSAFRLDAYLKDPDGQMIYISSFPVGLGAEDSTPVGKWVVRPHGKTTNPMWTNPRTQQTFKSGDPKNPVGKYWISLEGIDPATAPLTSYGIHGTIEPDSIGKMASMGCIRMRDDDIAMVYSMVFEGETTVVTRK